MRASSSQPAEPSAQGRHTIAFTPERYLGVWRSVNDVQVQLGPEGFAEFLRYVERKVANLETIPATYLTRAWVARKA